jgi:hypothetical protein
MVNTDMVEAQKLDDYTLTASIVATAELLERLSAFYFLRQNDSFFPANW